VIQAAIFGLGRWGQNLVNAVQHKSQKVQFKSAVVQTPSKYDDFAHQKKIKVTANPQEVLDDSEIQMLVLATPHNLHVQQIQTGAKFGKHVFCEKPLALTLEEAQKAVLGCEEAKVLLGVGHDKRFWPAMQELKKISAIDLFADESCRTEDDVLTCAAGFDGINIKLTKCGGITPALRMIEHARKLNLKIMLGSMNESTIGTAAIVHLWPLVDALDADGPLLLKEDIAEGLAFDNGCIELGTRNGLGIKFWGEKRTRDII